jgi:hypothetical protein
VRNGEAVDIILLTFNRLDYLVEMVDALERHTRWPYRLTIVDNVSGPETRNWLRRERERFHQVIFNPRNEHLAGYQRGISATPGSMFVLSDADVIPHPPTERGCWLTQLIALAERHPDFGLISTRLDTVTAARNEHLASAPLVDGEIIEAPSGVWLNLVRRKALRIPYMSDGITSYAIRRAGFRVGIAADVLATHLGDQDPERHPDYLARKQAASGLGTVYPDYPELANSRRPPLLRELAHAAPVLAAMERHGIEPADTVELTREAWPALAAVEPRVEAATRLAAGEVPLQPAGAGTIALVCQDGHDDVLLAQAARGAAEWILLLSPITPPERIGPFSLLEEAPGPAAALARLAAIGSSRRFQRILSYSTLEHRREWLALMRAACFDGPATLRLYVLRRTPPLPRGGERWRQGAPRTQAPPFRPRVRRARFGPLLTKAWRLVRAEWYLWGARR